MLRCGSAAAAYNVYPAFFHKIFYDGRHESGRLIIFPELIRQAGIRVCGYIETCLERKFFDKWPQLFSPKSTVKSDAEKGIMGNRYQECFQGLTCKGSSAGICYCARDHHGNADPFFFKDSINCKKCSFCIKYVKDSFNKQNMNTSVDKSSCLYRICFDKLVESNGAGARIIDIG